MFKQVIDSYSKKQPKITPMKKLCLTLMNLLCVLTFAWSQVAGDTKEVTHSFTFNDQFNNVNLDPSPRVGSATRQQVVLNYNSGGSQDNDLQAFAENLGKQFVVDLLKKAGVDVPSEVIDFVAGGSGFAGPQFKPKLGVVASVDYGAYYEVNSIGNADIGVTYPVEVKTIYPEPNTFGCGDKFTIETICEIQSGTDLHIQPPFYNMDIGPILQNLTISLQLGVDVSFCLGTTRCCGGCWTTPPGPEVCVAGICANVPPGIPGVEFGWNHTETIYTFNVPLPAFPALINFCEDAYGPGADMAALFGCSLSGATPILEAVQDAIDIYNNSQTPPRDYKIATFEPNLVTVFNPDLPSFPGLPVPPVPEFLGEFRKVTASDLSFSSINSGRRLRVNGTKTDLTKMSFDALSLLDFAGIPTAVSLGGGLGSIDLGDIAPTFQVDQDMSFSFDPIIHLALDLGVPMAYEVHDDVLGVVGSGNGQFVDLIAGQNVVATYPEALSDPTIMKNAYTMDGDFKTQTDQRYFTSFDINFLQLAFLGSNFTLFEDNIIRTETSASPDRLQDHTFNLTGFQTFNKEPITLDPEYPIIDVDYLGVEDVVNLGGGERTVVYRAEISNGGDVKLNNVRLNLDLGETYATAMSYSVECIHSDEVDLNASYDGGASKNLMGANVSLEVGGSASIEILVKVKPEISPIIGGGCFGTVDYYASTFAFGVSPIGTEVESNIYHCTDARTADDITSPVDLGASIIETLNDYTVYGWDLLRFDKPAPLLKGNAGSFEEIVFENVSLQNGPDLVIVGDVHSGSTIEVLGESHIIADYYQVTDVIHIHNAQSTVTATGAISQESDCASTIPSPDLVIPSNSSRRKVTVGNNRTKILEPGDYKEVRLRTNSELIMSAGVYNIGKWVFLGNNSTVKYDLSGGPITINLSTWQTLNRTNLSFMIDGDGEGAASDINYNYVGVQQTKFNSSFIQGSILAPNAEIDFSESSVLEGSCYARKVNFRTNSSYAGHKFLEELNINVACQDVLPPLARARSITPLVASKILEAKELVQERVQIYPNPFSNEINVDFSLESATEVSLYIFDLGGRTVYFQPNQRYELGVHKIEINSIKKLDPGMYTLYLRIGEEIITKKVIKL